MKKIFLLALLALFFNQTLFSQLNVDEKYKEAVAAYKLNDFESVVTIINQIKPLYKSVPPKVLYVEIMAKAQIIKADPFNDYFLLENTRSLTLKYLTANKKNINANYRNIQEVREQLLMYPKNQDLFNEEKVQIEREEAIKKEYQAKAEADARIKKMKEEEDNRKKLEMAKLQKERDRAQAERDRQAKAERDQQAQIKAQKALEEQEKVNQLFQAKMENQKIKEEKKDRSSLNSFSSIGFQSGEIAKYGILYETGGKRIIGFHIAARTSLTAEEDILKGSATENKTEIVLGPSIKFAKRFYLNIGAGYGYYNYIDQNDYAGTFNIKKAGYLVTTATLMIRITRAINANGGVSFIDIDKDFYKPEITFGLSFNLKGNY